MNPMQLRRRLNAFTLIELLCVVAIIGILAALLLPVLNQGKSRAHRAQCLNNLKQAGVAFLSFAHDHKERFPTQVPAAEGGTLELVQSGYRINGPFYFGYQHFAAISNELVTPRPLHCPTDPLRGPADDFTRFRNEHLSFFIGVTAGPKSPDALLAGDRNVTNSTVGGTTLVRHPYGSAIRWTAELHRNRGNLLFADGHVEERNTREVASAGGQRMGDLVLPTRTATSASAPSPTHTPGRSPRPRPVEPSTETPRLTSDISTTASTLQPALDASIAAESSTPRISSPAAHARATNAAATNEPAAAVTQSVRQPPSRARSSSYWWLLLLLLVAVLLGLAAAMRGRRKRRDL